MTVNRVWLRCFSFKCADTPARAENDENAPNVLPRARAPTKYVVETRRKQADVRFMNQRVMATWNNDNLE